MDEAEEIVLFPDLAGDRPAPTSSDELLGLADDPALANLREWLTLQLGTLDNRMRRMKPLAKPAGLTPELATYLQAREEQAALKATKDTYMKALGKLNHYARQGQE